MRKLTSKQERFVDEYLIDLNATQAAIRAGYASKNADVVGPALIGKSWVAEAIQARKAIRSERTAIDADSVIRRLNVEADGRGKDTSPSARVRALELLGKHLGMFPERQTVEYSGRVRSEIDVSVTTEAILERYASVILDRDRAGQHRLPAPNGTPESVHPEETVAGAKPGDNGTVS